MGLNRLRFNNEGLIPAVIQDISSRDVLMVAYMNEEALKRTLHTKKTHFFSRSRKRLWLKGETSGNLQEVKAIITDCDSDTLLIIVNQIGVTCHTGEWSCFYKTLYEAEGIKQKEEGILEEISHLIDDRIRNPREDSYTSSLLKGGKEKILAKFIEEADEIREDSIKDDRKGLIYETADLFYHLLVLLNYHKIDLKEVYRELKRRRRECKEDVTDSP